MLQDPKQLLLMHVEKVVLVVMGLLLLLVLYVYAPWSVDVPQKQRIHTLLQDGQKEMKSGEWRGDLKVEDYGSLIDDIYSRPWQKEQAPVKLDPNRFMFWNLPEKGVVVERAPEKPPVAPVAAVLTKADRGQVIIVFRIDEMGERKALENTFIPDYQGGLEVKRVEIYRVDKNDPREIPVLVTPTEGWVPPGMPIRYGTPTGSGLGPTTSFGIPVYIYAQMNPDPRAEEMRKRMEDEMRKKMDEEMRKRMEEDKRREEERRKQEEERLKHDLDVGRPPIPRPPVKTPVRPVGPVGPVRPVTPGTSEAVVGGWYYFLDQNNVDPDGRYEYNVVIVCRNPVYEKYKGTRDEVDEFVTSAPATSSSVTVGGDLYKRWYFQGGTRTDQMELGTFRVRSYVGGRRDLSPAEINQIVTELSGAADATKTPKKGVTPTKTTEPEGVWIEQTFTVRPGEEIGNPMTVTVGSDRRKVDFSTGCYLVAVTNDIQVVEDRRTVRVPGPDGTVRSEERVTRMVMPKLWVAYTDRRGALRTRWQEVAPALTRGPEKAN